MPPITWFLRPTLFSERPLVDALGCPPFLARLLTLRGMTDPAEARLFLDPKLKNLADPFLLPGMRPAIERILQAIDRGERIVLYGDYDVDGVTSLALFTRILRCLGADPHPFLPLRMDEGYGLSPEGLARCVAEHRPQLLLALDCGTCSVPEIAGLREQGIDVLVFDHHESKGERPACLAMVNPKLGADFHYLCSAGIVFKACHALLKERPVPGVDLRDYLDIVALGTVADIVPLRGENRILVHRGLLQLEKSRWTGVRALIDVAGIAGPFTPADIGFFKLGPRINAAGRLASAEQALELLLTDNHARAKELAAALNEHNRERQEVEKAIHREAGAIVEREFSPEHAAIVVGGDGWHPGVLGIIASRISKARHRATLVIGFDETGLGKGSGRSIEGLSMVKALTVCAGCLVKYGGHEMAAGVTIRRERFAEFQESFRREARALLTDDQLRPRLYVDAEVALADLQFDFLRHHETLQPFGIGNSQPLFLARNVRSAETRILKEKHYRFMLVQNGGGKEQQAIYFGGAMQPLPEPPWDIAFQVGRNEFAGRVSLQLEIKALRAAEAAP